MDHDEDDDWDPNDDYEHSDYESDFDEHGNIIRRGIVQSYTPPSPRRYYGTFFRDGDLEDGFELDAETE
jgi:hypothetical protein